MHRIRVCFHWTSGVALVASLVGCGSAPAAVLVRAADPSAFKDLRPGQPVIVEFNEGETIPLSLVVRGQFIETRSDTPSVTLVAKRHFFLRIQGNQMKASADGHFDETQTAKGVFDIGFNLDASGTKAHIAIVTPTYDLTAR